MNHNRDKKFLALTLMHPPIFFSIILKSVKQNVTEKGKRSRRVEYLFQP